MVSNILTSAKLRHPGKQGCGVRQLCGTLRPMRVFGIDCGTEITGYGVVESDDTGRQPRLVLKAMGAGSEDSSEADGAMVQALEDTVASDTQ